MIFAAGSVASVQRIADAIWSWWLHEISGLLGEALAARLRRRERPKVRCFANGQMTRIASAEPDETHSERPLAPAVREAAIGVVLELPGEWVMRQRVQLPLAAAPQARAAIGFMLNRLSPFAKKGRALSRSAGHEAVTQTRDAQASPMKKFTKVLLLLVPVAGIEPATY